MPTFTNNKDTAEYWDPEKGEIVKLDVSGWSGADRKALHDDLGWYLNANGDHVYGIKPTEWHWGAGDTEGLVVEGADPNPVDPNVLHMLGMGGDGRQAQVNTATGETNVQPTGAAQQPTGGAQQPSGPTGADLQKILEALSGMMPGADPQAGPTYEGKAVGQDMSTGYTKPQYASPQGVGYGEVQQKARLGAPQFQPQPQPVGQPTPLQPQEQVKGLLSNLFNQSRKK